MKIIKNNGIADITIIDVGITILAATQYTIPSQDYMLWASSNDIIVYVGSSQLIVNDGSVDLELANAIALIQGNFTQKLKIADTDGKTIDSVLDTDNVRRLAIDIKGNVAAFSGIGQLSEKVAITIDGEYINAWVNIPLSLINKIADVTIFDQTGYEKIEADWRLLSNNSTLQIRSQISHTFTVHIEGYYFTL